MNMTRDEILIRIGKILGRLDLTNGTTQMNEQVGLLGHGIGLDSIEILGVIAAIEEEFGLTVDDEELRPEYFQTLGTLVSFVQEKLV